MIFRKQGENTWTSGDYRIVGESFAVLVGPKRSRHTLTHKGILITTVTSSGTPQAIRAALSDMKATAGHHDNVRKKGRHAMNYKVTHTGTGVDYSLCEQHWQAMQDIQQKSLLPLVKRLLRFRETGSTSCPCMECGN